MITSAWFGWLVVLPIVVSPLAYLVGRLESLRWQDSRLSRRMALTGLAGTWVVFVLAARDFISAGPATIVFSTIALRFDGLSLLLAALALALGTMVVIFSGKYVQGNPGEEKYYALLMTMIGAIIGLGSAADLFNLWLWFETMTVSSYLLVAFYREEPTSLEAGVKYLVQSASGSMLILLGIGLVLAQTGDLGLEVVRVSLPASPVLLAAGAFFTVGFGIKIALFPLHTWLPDAHAQAPSGISAMLSGVVIEAGLVALLRTITALSGVIPSWGMLLMAFGALNMLMGNLLALRQTQVKRLLAYSSVSQVGYMLLGLGISLYTGQMGGAQGGLFHLLTHGLMKGLAFLASGALLYGLHITSGDHSPLTIGELSGAARRYPLVALSLSLAVLGLGGLPPLAGFMSKWQIFVAGFATRDALIEVFIVFAALNSVLSLAYYMPLVNVIYRQKPSQAVLRGQPLPVSMCIPLFAMALLVIAVGVWPNLLNWLSQPAGAALAAAFGG